jgi:hypothetical protein
MTRRAYEIRHQDDAGLVISGRMTREDKIMAPVVTSLQLLAVAGTLALGASASAESPRFITFDAPSAGTAAGQVPLPQGTFPYAINDAGQGSLATNISLEGVIAGTYLDASNAFHSFLRAPDGATTVIDVQEAGTTAFQGTVACAVDCLNADGMIVGYFIDTNNVNHAFLRAPGGAIATFDAPGAGAAAGQGTFALGINEAGVIAGSYLDANNVYHGFVRTRDGTITAVDVSGAGAAPFQGTLPSNINSEGAITGNYVDANASHGFLRATDGTLTTFDVPSVGTAHGGGTTPVSNNAANAIAGWYTDASGLYHGFLRTGRHCGEDRGEDRCEVRSEDRGED